MKKGMKKLIAILISAVLCVSAITVFPACGGDDENGINYAEAVVTSNGGTTVVVDKEVYYINGIADYTDASGETNLNGSVVKGGLYKTTVTDYRDTIENTEEANGGKDLNADYLYDVMDFANYSKLNYIQLGYYTIGSDTEPARVTDSEGNSVQNYISTNGNRSEYRINSEQVISKKIGTSGYADGGFWIFDGIVYFASPDTDKDTEGNVLYERAVFYSYNLVTKSLNKIRTATEISTTTPYAFYKRGDSVYLVTYETYYANADDEADNIKTGYIVSTEIKNGVAGETKEIAENVTSAYFPRVETYDPNNNPANTLEHYIYYTTTDETSEKDVSVLAMVRPDGVLEVNDKGKEVMGSRIISESTVGDITIEGTTSDYLYYRNPSTNGSTALECTNLEVLLKQYDSNAVTFKMPENSKIIVSDISNSGYTAFLPIEQDKPDNAEGVTVLPCVMAASSNGIFRLDPINGTTKVFNGEGTMIGYNNGRVYFTYTGSTGEEEETDSTDSEEDTTDTTVIASCSAFEHFDNQTAEFVGLSEPNTTFNLDFFKINYNTTFAGNENYVASETYAMYYSAYSTTETNYGYISKVDGVYRGGSMSVKLGVVASFDKPAIECHDDECVNWTHDHSSWEDLTTDEEEETTTQ